jgi:hypothetical protein
MQQLPNVHFAKPSTVGYTLTKPGGAPVPVLPSRDRSTLNVGIRCYGIVLLAVYLFASLPSFDRIIIQDFAL